MKKSTRRWLGLGVTAGVLGLVVYHLTRSPDWQNFDWNHLWRSLLHARPEYLLAAVAASYLTFLLRALRWRYFLDPIKRASLWGLFAAQILGFSSIYLIGRVGEAVRPAYIARREDVPFASQLAILLLERIYDTVATMTLFAMALRLEPTARAAHLGEYAYTGLIFIALAVMGLVLFRLYSEPLTARVERAFSFLPSKWRSQLSRFLRSLSSGLDAIRDWRDLLASLACSVALWFLNVSIFWLVFQSLGGAPAQVSWWGAALTLVFAAAGLLVQLPGVGGGYQVLVIQALHIFHVEAQAATGAGILAGVVAQVPCWALGLLILLYEGLTFKKLGAIAKEERATMEEKV
ncbi:MAG: hypothetical protein DMG25_07495 [Acidobacteria bacterium]|nr:MAG: hypothetical protein DMG25_07495 [Acidobacteriota bacterium]